MNIRFEFVDPDRFVLDPPYQRAMKAKKVAAYANNFSMKYVGCIICSLRPDGSLVVIDGQHRVRAALEAGVREWLPTLVYEGLSYEEEADVFSVINKQRITPSPYSIFTADLEAGKPDAREIAEILADMGLRLTSGDVKGGIQSVAQVRETYDRHGPPGVVFVLGVLRDAFGDDSSSFQGSIISAVTKLYAKNEHIERKHLTDTLRRSFGYATSLVGRARAVGSNQDSAAALIARLIVSEYNRGFGSRSARRIEY